MDATRCGPTIRRNAVLATRKVPVGLMGDVVVPLGAIDRVGITAPTARHEIGEVNGGHVVDGHEIGSVVP
jgi:hypothetical protein